jgi:hypothetical protein
MAVSNPKVLRKLKIDEFSLVDVPASVGSDVLIWKRGEGEAAGRQRPVLQTSVERQAYIAKMDAEIATLKASRAVDEAMALLAKRDPESVAKAGAILRSSPDVYDAYRARMAGERYEAPVAKAEDGRSSIERSLAEGQARLREITKAQMDEQKLAEAKAKLRGIFDKLKTKRDRQVAEARQELNEVLGTAEGRAAVYDLAVIGELAAAV